MSSAQKFEDISMKGDRRETRIALLEQINIHISESLKEIKDDMKIIKSDINSLNYQFANRFNEVNEKINSIHLEILAKISTNNKWLIGMAITVFLSFFGIALNFAAQLYLRS